MLAMMIHWIYFDFPEDGVNRISHVGICIKNNGNGTIQVIEGNTSGTSKGDQRNGGMCVEKTRAYVKDNKLKLINGIVGWGRPVYAGEENLPLLSKVGSSDVPVKTTKPVAVKAAAPAAKPASKDASAFKPLKNGSKGDLVKQIQKSLKLKVDGQFGPGTEKAVKAFQSSKGLSATGIVDSNTFKAIKGK